MNDNAAFDRRCRALVEAIGLGRASDVTAVEPLTGGVASDIARVDLNGRFCCVKFALEKLKVAEDWRAPVHRNAAEYAWLTVVSAIAPASVPKLHGRSDRLNGFAMEYLDASQTELWKTRLLTGTPDPRDAAVVGALLGRIHAATSRPDFDRGPFHNQHDFWALRLDPYLIFTAARHPSLAAPLTALADRLHAADIALIHGDVSPKNIFLRDATPILLDAECATMGDPCFDVAFCLNHLVLKAVHRPGHAPLLRTSLAALWTAYAPQVSWEAPAALEARVAALLPALMLARVDGKSPVEYLDPAARQRVRDLAIPAIAAPVPRLDDLVSGFGAGFSA